MAVFTPVAFDEAAQFWEAYRREPLRTLTPIVAGTENTNYFINDAYVLTLFERRTRAEDLPYFVQLMQAGVAAGLPVPNPVPLQNGECVRTLLQKPALVVSKLPGADQAEPSAVQAFAAGAMLARLHAAGRAVEGLDNRLGCAALLDMAQALQVEIVLPEVPELPQTSIHGDYFPDNVLFEGDAVSGVIDFYFACVDSCAYDLAIALTAWQNRAHDLLAGYRSVRPLSADETEALPVLCRRAAARFYLTRLYDQKHPRADALLKPKNPDEYLHKLRFFEAHPDWPW